MMATPAYAAAELLRVNALHAFYGESHILHGVDFTVGTGELVTLLGRNGSGRTTTLKAIVGLVGRRTGSVMVNGVETIGMPSHRIAHLGIGYCPEPLRPSSVTSSPVPTEKSTPWRMWDSP